MQYRSYDCDQIALESANVERRVSELYTTLKKDAEGDEWQMGVGMILFWPTLFALEGGDSPAAGEYARLKGEYKALETVSVEKKCAIKYQDKIENIVKE